MRRFPSRLASARMPDWARASRMARTWLVGRQYQSIAARGATSVEDRWPSLRMRSSSSSTSALCSTKVVRSCSLAVPVPGDAVPRQLGGRDEGEALVVGLVDPALLVQEGVGPLAAIAGDPRRQDEVVVAPGDLERVELDRTEPLEDGLDRRRLGRQRPRRRQQMAAHEEPARGRAVDRLGGRGHSADGSGTSLPGSVTYRWSVGTLGPPPFQRAKERPFRRVWNRLRPRSASQRPDSGRSAAGWNAAGARMRGAVGRMTAGGARPGRRRARARPAVRHVDATCGGKRPVGAKGSATYP